MIWRKKRARILKTGIKNKPVFRLGALAAAACVLLCSCAGSTKTVDATPFVRAAYYGEDGSGKAVLTVDQPGLLSAVYAAMALSATPETGSDAAIRAAKIVAALSVSVTPEEALSNGDSVTVSGTVDEDALSGLGIGLSFTPHTDTVDGLEDTQQIDPFANITVSWEGYAPDITMSITQQNSTDVPWSWISYLTSGNTGLSAGSTVTVTATAETATLERLGYRLSRTEQEYTVPDVGSYLTDWDSLDAEGEAMLQTKAEMELAMLSAARPAGFAFVQAGADPITLDDSVFTYSNFVLDSVYLLTSANDGRADDSFGWYNAAVCVYRFDISSGDGAAVTAYSAFALPDIAQSASGLAFQSESIYEYRTAQADRASFAVSPSGSAYQVAEASFQKAATLESATPE
jgi:hypothetical protein